MAKPIIRCSSLPILSKCLGMIGAELTVDVEQDVTATGTLVHQYAAQLIVTGAMPEYTGSDSDVPFVLNRVKAAWNSVKAEFPNPVVERGLEYELKHFVLSGHPDLYGVPPEGGVGQVLDFKSGYLSDGDVLPQLMGYGFLIQQVGGQDDSPTKQGGFHLQAAWLREGTFQEWTYPWSHVAEWMAALHRQVGAWNGRDFTAGDHCRYCPRFHQCPARTALARSAVEDLLGTNLAGGCDRGALAPLLPDLYGKAKMLERQLETFNSWLREEIRRGGPIVTADGKQLGFGSRNRTNINVAKGWPVIRQSFTTDAEIASFLAIKKEKMLEAVAAHSAPREKGKDQQALMLRLEKAGAVTTVPEQFLQWQSQNKETNE